MKPQEMHSLDTERRPRRAGRWTQPKFPVRQRVGAEGAQEVEGWFRACKAFLSSQLGKVVLILIQNGVVYVQNAHRLPKRPSSRSPLAASKPQALPKDS